MRKGRATAWMLAALICFCAVPDASAVEPLELHMEGVAATDGGLLIYCNTNAEETPRGSDFSVTLGNTALDVLNAAPFAGTDGGVSFVFLVDVSGSIRAAQFEAIKDTIALICEGLSERDNISIFAIGDGTYTQPFVSAPEDIRAQIDAIERSREDTNLYDSIRKSLSILNTHEHCHDKKALVVFSDGEEDIFDGITMDELNAFIDESHIPIYTVATLGPNPPSRYVETAKILGSFARRSPGGRHYIHNNSQSVTEEIAEDVLDSIRKSLIVEVSLSGFSSSGEDLMLRIELTVSDMGKASAGYAIPTAGLSVPEEEAPPEGTPDPDSTPDAERTPPPGRPSPSETPSDGTPGAEQTPGTGRQDAESPSGAMKTSFIKDNLMWIIIGGAVLLLLIIVLIIVLVLRRKKAAAVFAPIPVPAQMPPVPTPMQPMPSVPPPMPARAPPPAPPPGKPRISLRLTKVGLVEEQVFRAEFAGELTIGRDPEKASLPFKDDDMLSAKHCSISYEPEGIVLRDLGSTNGTFVNGVPVSDQYLLESDDILLIGSMELRINWQTL